MIGKVVASGLSQINMLDIILVVVAVLAACGIYIYRSGTKQRLLNELTVCYNEALTLRKSCTVNSLPGELQRALHQPLEELTLYLKKIEGIYKSELAIFRVRQILKEDKPSIEAKNQEIKGICSRWNKYASFKQHLTEELSELCSSTNTLNEGMQALVRHDDSYQDIVQIRATGVLTLLEEYQAKYKDLTSLSFEDYTDEHCVPVLTDEFQRQVNILTQELQYFSYPLKVIITGLYRKSIYYINLEDSTEKSTRRHSGTVQVSYKTFRDVNKGDPYKWGIVIGNKYTTGEQNITIKTYKEEELQTSITYRLTKEQFAEIFQTLTFNRKFEETTANNIPYQMNSADLNVLICEKSPHTFDVTYYLDLFNNTSIYDFLSYNNTTLELSAAADNGPPPVENSANPAEEAILPEDELANLIASL